MSDVQTSLPATTVMPGSRAATMRRAAAALQTCLVVSTSAQRAQRWVRAAHDEQWATIVCNTADEAHRQAVRNRIELALVDLQSTSAAQEQALRNLVERLAEQRGMLLAVCGNPDDCLGEVWSRQLGVWMYLPGIDTHSDIELLCSEARLILEKQHRFAVHPVG